MGKYETSSLFDTYMSLLASVSDACMEWQLVWLTELVIVINALNISEHNMSKYVYYYTYNVESQLPSDMASYWKCLVRFRNRFVHSGIQCAKEEFLVVLDNLEGIHELLEYNHIVFDKFNECGFYKMGNEELYK